MKTTNLFTAIALAAAFCFFGCESDSSDEARAYDRQKSLDDGDYANVLELTKNCGGDQACLMDRGAAYMGLAGFDAPTIIEAVTDEKDDKRYFELLSDKIKPDANERLKDANVTYGEVIKARGKSVASCADSGVSLNSYENSACFNRGLTSIGSSAVIADEVAKLYDDLSGSCGNTIDTCFSGAANGEIRELLKDAAGLIWDESNVLIDMINVGDSDVKGKVEEIKGDICSNLGNNCSKQDILANLDNIFQYIIKSR
ncbi:MAG: hypothetical protein LBP89_00990 [Helicobacteraceae bacterium]|jgi:hypothetical protein|nr:hypothetical protein [Helicobacteraceae bacterium]